MRRADVLALPLWHAVGVWVGVGIVEVAVAAADERAREGGDGRKAEHTALLPPSDVIARRRRNPAR
jgi:hypothetical protein